MVTHTISNDKITLTVSEHGAEIVSLIRRRDNKELMWQADPKFWGRTSPVLFPLVGNYFEKESIYDGKTYTMGQHGFARDMDFHLVAKTEDKLKFLVRENEMSKEKYPFDFYLTIAYEISGDEVKVIWNVKNTGIRTMYFSIGGHPAFNCDLPKSKLLFEKKGQAVKNDLTSGVIEGDGSGCLSEREKTISLKDSVLALSDELFDEDALIFENNQADAVTLLDEHDRKVLKVSFDAPLFGVWSPAKKFAPFVCIEPWYGRCDRVGFNKKLEEREYGTKLEIGDEFYSDYIIKII
jgi:galactose mutarotase-like enzyme